jgi:hypothetical protein
MAIENKEELLKAFEEDNLDVIKGLYQNMIDEKLFKAIQNGDVFEIKELIKENIEPYIDLDEDVEISCGRLSNRNEYQYLTVKYSVNSSSGYYTDEYCLKNIKFKNKSLYDAICGFYKKLLGVN